MNKIQIRPFIIFNGIYDDVRQNREGVINTKDFVSEILFGDKNLNYNREEAEVIVNGNCTDILKKLRSFLQKYNTRTDLILFYYCGHGCPGWSEKKLYLAMKDTDFDHPDDNALDVEKVTKLISEYCISYYAIVLDCCYSGLNYSMGDSKKQIINYIEEYDELKGSIFIPTAEANEKISTIEINGNQQLPFTYYFFDTLKKGIKNEFRRISFAEIIDVVKKKMSEKGIKIPVRECKGDLDKVAIWENLKYRTLNNKNSRIMKDNILRVLLVKSTIAHPIKHDDFGVPLGLWLLKGYIDSYCMDVDIEIYDERLELCKCEGNSASREKIRSQFREVIRDYDVIGISMSTSEVKPALNKFKIAKEQNKITVAGGIFTSSNEKYLLSTKLVDYVTPGVGATSLRKLLEWLLKQKNGKRINEINSEISGVATINNLDDFFVPSDDELPNMTFQVWQEIVERYKPFLQDDKGEYKIDIYSSRGCKGSCTFCSVQKECGRQITFRAIDSVINDVKFLYKKGFTYFSLKDEDCFSEPERFMRIIKSIQLPNIKFKIRTRIDHLLDNKEMLIELKRLGVVEIQYGIESSSYMILSNIDKGIKRRQIEKVKNFIKEHADLGIIANCSFILGLEGESEEYYDELLEFVKEIYDYHDNFKPKIYINFLVPHPRNSSFPVKDFNMITNDLDYFTHKYPVGFYSRKIDLPVRKKMLDTYETIIEYTNSKRFNPSLKDNEKEYEYLEAFRIGNKFILSNPELPYVE